MSIARCAFNFGCYLGYFPSNASSNPVIPFLHRYFEGGVSSVYLWDTEDNGFAGVVLIKKSTCVCV